MRQTPATIHLPGVLVSRHRAARRALTLVTALATAAALVGPSASAADAPPRPFERFTSPAAAAHWQLASFVRAIEAAADGEQAWNGSVSGCDAGSRSTAEKERIVGLVNLHRYAAGVPPLLGPHAPSDALAQEAALLMEANNALDHTPPTSWRCWSQAGADGASDSNIAIGYTSWQQVLAYMVDDGDNNEAVGHRQWLLEPTLERVGVGATTRGGAIRVIDVPTRASTGPRVVAWPVAGASPSFLVPTRWSVSFHSLDTKLKDATVHVTRNGQPVPIKLLAPTVGYGGFTTIVWEMPHDVLRAAATTGPDTTTFRVTVRAAVLDGVTQDYSYDVEVVPDRFDDDDGGIFEADAIVLAGGGVTRGCNTGGTAFCPDGTLTRGELAAMLVRALGLPPASRDWFTDDGHSIFEADINRLREAGITRGCDPAGTRYCPDAAITRAEIATFFDRAFDLDPSSRDWFTDDETSVHEAAIDRFREARITLGCNPPGNTRYCPQDDVTRGQIAAFFVRSDLVRLPG